MCVDVTALKPVVCCAKEGMLVKFSPSKGECFAAVSFTEAFAFCDARGYHLCTTAEIESNSQCGNGCEFDYDQSWTGDHCDDNGNAAAFVPEQSFTQAPAPAQVGGQDCIPAVQGQEWDWPTERKVACCESSAVACYQCDEAASSSWSFEQSDFCCQLRGVGCQLQPIGAAAVPAHGRADLRRQALGGMHLGPQHAAVPVALGGAALVVAYSAVAAMRHLRERTRAGWALVDSACARSAAVSGRVPLVEVVDAGAGPDDLDL